MTRIFNIKQPGGLSVITRSIYHTLRYLLIAVFLWSGISKAMAPQQFAEVVAAYGLLPENVTVPVALFLIAAEIIAAAGLCLEIRGSLGAITSMILVFLVILGYGIYLGLDIDCGCFGPDDPEGLAFHDLRGAFIRDIGLLCACGYLYCWRFLNRLAPAPWFHTGLRPVTLQED